MFGNFKRLPFFYWIYLSVVYHEDVCGGSSIENINILQNNEKDRNEFLTNFLSLSASSLLKGNLLFLLFRYLVPFKKLNKCPIPICKQIF